MSAAVWRKMSANVEATELTSGIPAAKLWLCIYSLCNSILLLRTMCDGVLHCFWCVVNVFLVSLHGD